VLSFGRRKAAFTDPSGAYAQSGGNRRKDGEFPGMAGSKEPFQMTVALQQFPEQLAPILLKKGGVGIGPLMSQDVAPLFIWINDIEAVSQDFAYRPTDKTAFATWLNAFAADPTRVLFVIRLAGSAEAAGFLVLSAIQPVHRSAELGIRVGREGDRGRGIGKAALSLALEFAWDHLNLVRVQLRVLADNERAIKAYRGAGFAIEGRHANAAYIGGRWHDMITMAAFNPRENIARA
jgi:RimJ/RimL family protein N-acetyltransferase